MHPKFVLTAITFMGITTVWASGDPVPCISREKKNDLAGTIIHGESKKPLKDVAVTAFLISRKEKTVITDVTGNYGFQDLMPGTYKFVFEKSGYRKVTKENVVVKTNEVFLLNIEMIENREFDIIPSPLLFADF